MENQSDTINQAPFKPIVVYLDGAIRDALPQGYLNPLFFKFVSAGEAQYSLYKKNQRLWIQFPDGEFCDYPYYLKNVCKFLEGLKSQALPLNYPTETFQSFVKSTETIERKVFSNVAMTPGQNVKDLWDEIIKKVNSISSESYSLRDLISKILDVPFLRSSQTSMIILHLKGQTKAELLGTMWRSEKVHGLIEVKDFNQCFNSIKKSKIKSFSTETFPKVNLPFNGSFLAKEVISKKYSLIAIVSRHDFLNYGTDEIDLFETCIDLLQPHFERLIDQEFSDKKISELRICLKDFPLPLRLRDNQSGSTFVNDLFRTELQEQDIFYNKKVMGPFSLDLYDCDELRHYAFDLFHFQRISLLGELLNTLRHELSNPLFGLKLSSQIFSTFNVSNDDKLLMEEIEKNVNRCQTIIENFSNLYQIQPETKPILLKKMIDESLVLAKSEIREVIRKINYSADAEKIYLNVPLIFVVQILFNLIVNAAQAMRNQSNKPELRIDITLQKSNVLIDVIDNGPGVPTEVIGNLFKPFFTTKTQGTGLGLVLSRNLTLKMGGNLEYIISHEQRGAHFRLTLPIS